MNNISNITITLAVDGQPCIVVADQEKLQIAINLLSELEDDGKLKVNKLNPNKYKLNPLEEDDYKEEINE